MADGTSTSGNLLGTVINTLSSILIEAGILLMVGVWTVMWIFLGLKTAEVQGSLEAVIIGIYTLVPVVAVLLWRLSYWTGVELPGVANFADTPEQSVPEEPEAESEVAQRFETGGQGT